MKKKELQTPCFVVNEAALKRNLSILKGVRDRTGCKILLAQKCFSMYHVYPLIGQYLDGVTASGLYEARLGYEELGQENHIFSPAYTEREMKEIIDKCDHIIFNSVTQAEKFGKQVKQAKKSAGIRVNPQCSTQEGHAIYDPCAPGSRLGVLAEELWETLPEYIEGLHFHTLCEQNADALATTIKAVEEKFAPYLRQVKWINLGGGHHITREDYDIALLEQCIRHLKETYQVEVYLEPGEAVALNAGELVTTVIDLVHDRYGQTERSKDGIAILDASAACHMPDVLEMPYRPPLKDSGETGEKAYTYLLAGPTCLAGDVIESYSFDEPLRPGERLYFQDMAIYTMVKTNTFNGMKLPDIVLEQEDGECKMIRQFTYEDFKSRL
ncbi:MAG: carboxynorspermidine decarboxylase [Lachnospiraceae bacterium]|jgi:carboxynorspermidine decarboxylase|nr:carboxynorspermidine decarboxylase [Lachnospiraceae bacterium]